MEEQTKVEASGLVHDEESDVTSRNALPRDEPPPPPPQPTPQDFSSLLFMMQQQMQSQHMMYQAQMEYQKLQTETVAAQNQSIEELKKELATAKSNKVKEQSAKPTKPVVNAGQTDSQWLLFLDSWKRYKNLANLSNPERVRNELRAACADDVNELLFELHGPQQLDSMTEDELLAAIHKVAVDCVHEEVHRQSFFRMKQDIGEPIHKFMARLKAQANLCNFKVECTCAHTPTESEDKHLISFSEAMLSHQLVSGLADEEWKEKMLAEADTLNSLSKKFDRLVCIETVGKSAPQLTPGQLQDNSKSAVARSAYKSKKLSAKDAPNKQSTQQCDYCGLSPHNRKDCPASRKICSNCNKLGHFSAVCKSAKRNASKSATAQTEVPQNPQPTDQQQPSMASAATCPTQDFRLGLEGGSFL